MTEALKYSPESLPADVLITRVLANRPRRASSLQAELGVYNEILSLTSTGSEASITSLLDIACRLCNAGSAGLSILRTDEQGNNFIRWESVSGALSPHEGDETSPDRSPCGLCIDTGETVLMWRPERAYRHLSLSLPQIVENLIAPLDDGAGNPLGTLWVAHHDSRSGFCANDAKVLEHLAAQMSRNLKAKRAAREHRDALLSLGRYEESHRELTRELNEERNRRALAETAEKQLREALVFKEAATYEAHHRAKNSLQIAASLLSMHARAASAPEVRESLDVAHARLHVLARVHELLYRGNAGGREVQMSSLLEAVADALRKSFAERSELIVLTVVSQQLSLVPERAMPLALLANELMTNAYKHAFPDTARGEISLRFGCNAQNELVMQVTDDGVGLTDAEDGTKLDATLGMRLVRIFAKQLHGELNITVPADSKGTQVTLTAPLLLE